MSRPEVQTRVLELLATVLKTPVDAGASTETLPAWDSLRHIEVIFAVEDAFGVQFPEETLGELTSVERVVDAVLAQQ
jgi:acyl carrier protein